MKKCITTLLLSFLFFLSLALSPIYAQPIQNPTNGHWYQLIDLEGSLDWSEARDYAAGLSYNGLQGHLATVTSSQEGDFIKANFFPFVGTDEVYVWIGGSQLNGQSQPDSGWRWLTGETWSSLDWGPGEPNDCCNPPGPPQETDDENCLEYKEDPSDNVFWNDAPCSSGHDLMIIEYEQQARVQSVPTMTEWGMIIFMVLAGLGSVYYMKRQRRA